ncbi:hypothetical protein OL548_34590 (plasmid) [Lysinibacillus sp. MHQ-1]|nr:hypothetical protein OL548_34590 [Lysinibacillus sp. MHQ-1]
MDSKVKQPSEDVVDFMVCDVLTNSIDESQMQIDVVQEPLVQPKMEPPMLKVNISATSSGVDNDKVLNKDAHTNTAVKQYSQLNLFNDGNVESQNIIKTERNSEGSETNLSERKESVVEQKVFSKANKKKKKLRLLYQVSILFLKMLLKKTFKTYWFISLKLIK